MAVNEIKTSINGLRIGMFVSRLDKPWLETPFLLEGMKIEGKEQIEQLKKHCAHVFVDADLGPAPDSRYWVLASRRQTNRNNNFEVPTPTAIDEGKSEYSKLRKCHYSITSSFDEELKTAKKTYSEVSIAVQDMMHTIKKGRALNVDSLKKGVSAMVDSIERNPSAFALVYQLRKTDDYSYNRALGTSAWCATFGRHLGLERHDIEILALGGMLIDIGKIKLPCELITKTEPLTQSEKKVLQTHVNYGVRIVAKVKKLHPEIANMVASHHERADGSGYPMGVDNKKIPMFGRIAGIADSFDAMTTKCPYRDKVFSPHEATTELYKFRGTKFQAELVEQFIQTVGLFPTGSLVELDSGEVGVVVAINGLKRLRPTIMILLDENKTPYEDFHTVDLTKVMTVRVKNGLPPGAFGIDMGELFL